LLLAWTQFRQMPTATPSADAPGGGPTPS
jgi:hypothetical protein